MQWETDDEEQCPCYQCAQPPAERAVGRTDQCRYAITVSFHRSPDAQAWYRLYHHLNAAVGRCHVVGSTFFVETCRAAHEIIGVVLKAGVLTSLDGVVVVEVAGVGMYRSPENDEIRHWPEIVRAKLAEGHAAAV